MSVTWQYDDERKRRRLAASQPRVRWDLAIFGACLMGAAMWGGLILLGRLLLK